VGHTCGNAAVAKSVRETLLEDPDNPFPSTKCCPELAKHLDISLGVDCHRLLVVVLEPEWSIDAMFGDGNPGSALHRV